MNQQMPRSARSGEYAHAVTGTPGGPRCCESHAIAALLIPRIVECMSLATGWWLWASMNAPMSASPTDRAE